DGEFQALADAHFPVLLVEEAEVEGGQRDNDGDEGQPEPRRGAKPVDEQEIQECAPLDETDRFGTKGRRESLRGTRAASERSDAVRHHEGKASPEGPGPRMLN